MHCPACHTKLVIRWPLGIPTCPNVACFLCNTRVEAPR